MPQETVAVNTDIGEVVDAFNRQISERGKATELSDVQYTVTPDPGWPAGSVVIIDTSTDEVIETFGVDSNGKPIQ
ncbi:hypothetical protein [uncultured Arthrobacter sp.]|uniref:hypothetical protein n=1 Tax=uncultured Arthrobacter sp. TaxID=114050 RepID=UPI002623D860|nr:hypothetical protein [uncultured Arthrobacter sp.]